ncbi:sigma-54 dependent transcriptional regulator [Myxococcota bacterium]|nr:sigma-54 dependent transcriptional regulator [Myxococcota bacterium]MBU1380001.1 sigma-54 dependent transcriptional regulator [Myxococcota bacterium]MBU1496758.1 sigma-54 dependent transcriptional regulator [Myxococcota bacterium]
MSFAEGTEKIRKVLVIDDEIGILHILDSMLRKMNCEVFTSNDGNEGLHTALASDIELIITDVRLPGVSGLEIVEEVKKKKPSVPVIVMSAYGTIDMAVEAMKKGAFNFISKPFRRELVVHSVSAAFKHLDLINENIALKTHIGEGFISGNTVQMNEIISKIRKIAPFRTNVLICGESGTGKEMAARMIHTLSSFSGPFIAVNCGSIPEHLLESELFGHTRGAFTGAHEDRKGLFTEATDGTLFLDEIGELDISLQVKLLRVLQEGKIRPVGSNKEQSVNARIIAATSRDLPAEIKSGNFREDLFFRLNVVPLTLPPLRDRIPDISLFAEFFLNRFSLKFGIARKSISPEAMNVLENYEWPGNIREMENLMERICLISESAEIQAWELGIENNEEKIKFIDEDTSGDLSIKRSVRSLERKLIKKALEITGGKKGEAARLLEISPRALLYKLKEYNIIVDEKVDFS